MPARTATTRRRRPRITEPQPATVPQTAPPAAGMPPWLWALIVVGVIGLAHLGLFLLLTVSARKEVGRLEERWSAARLAAAEDPGTRPHEAAEVPAWLKAQRVWEDGKRWAERSEFVSMLGWGLTLSFLFQMGILGVLLYRSTHAARRRRA